MESSNINKKMKPVKNWLLTGIVVIVLVLGFVILQDRTPAHLDAPILAKTLTKVSSSLPLSGLCYPEANVLILSEERLIHSTVCNPDGEFTTSLTFNEEGMYKLNVKQHIKEVISESTEHDVEVDLTPPIEDLKVNKLPGFSNEKTIAIIGETKATGASLLFNNREYGIDENGKFTVQYSLKEGKNNFTFYLVDDVGNTTRVLAEHSVEVDSTPPKISTGFCSLYASTLGETEEYLCIKTGQWQGWGTSASVPIVGNVKGKFSKITVDGKRIYPDENNEIYQRITLYTPHGLNKYKVVAVDEAGNKSTGNLEMTVVDVSRDSTDEILDRLDDIESQL